MKENKRPAWVILCIIIIILITMWTGTIIQSKDNFIENIHDIFIDYIIDAGMSNVDIVELSQNDNSASFQWKMIFNACPFMTYLVENSEDIDKKSMQGSKSLSSVYLGYRSRNFLWSGAGNDMAVTSRLFENSDIQVADLIQEEEDYEKMLAENERLKNGESNTVDDTEENNENSQDENTEEDIKQDSDNSNKSNEKVENNRDKKPEKDTNNNASTVFSPQVKNNLITIQKLKKSKSRSYLLKNFYITDSSTSIDNSIFNVEKLLAKDVTLKKSKKPQILIFHTHGGSEAFIDSRKGKKSDSIVGVGSRLAYILRKKYGYNVIHDTTEYDKINGSIDRNKAYNNAAGSISKILEANPSIEVVIDLHRDGVGNTVQRLTTINGEKTAQVMFFNGLSRNASGNIDYLYNKNLQANLAFSLQMKLKCMENYPDFAKPIYLKNYRYNMHLREKFLLIELGNENNTVKEAKNAMEPLAKVLDQVLQGK